MDLKDTALSHNRWVAIFEAVKKGTFDDTGGEAVMEFILDDKLGESDPSTGKNLVCTPLKCPRFMPNDFDPDSGDKISGGLPLDTKRWIWVENYFKTAGTWLLNLKGHPERPSEDMH